ncbi:type IV pilus assembly protein PilM [Patescibacteria group bacterium]
MSKKSHPDLFIGIDISDYSIEVLQLTKEKEVFAYGRTLLIDGIVQNGKVVDKKALIKKITEVLKTTRPNSIYENISNFRAVFSVSESLVFLSNFELPAGLKGQSLNEKVLEVASEKIPLHMNKTYNDFLNTDISNNIQKIIFASAKKEVVDDFVSVLRKVGFGDVSVSVESFALGKAFLKNSYFEYLGGEKSEKTSSVIVDIGARKTIISIFDEMNFLHNSIVVPVGGNQFTENLSKKLNINIKEAERNKRDVGLSREDVDSRVLSVLQYDFQKIISEIKGLIDFYEKNNSRVENLILVGGSSLIPKVEEYFEENFGISANLGKPFINIKSHVLFDENRLPMFFAGVIGLALYSEGDNIDLYNIKKVKTFFLKKINFLPDQNTRILLMSSVLLVFIMILLLMIYFRF